MYKKLLMLTCLLAFLLAIPATAQKTITVSGKVTDNGNNPVIGANVIVKGTSTGTSTDADGKYTIKVPSNGKLMFSYLGMQAKEEPVNGLTVINATLNNLANDLSEVVVVGYGAQKKVNLTGAVASVKGSDINLRPISQVSQALQGVASGVYVNTESGEPGNDNATITVRGIGTLNDAAPLILVDGIAVASMNLVNPDDIESISILKDAASASIYGTRAANGVVLITTKRGSDSKTSVTYNTYYSVTKPTVLLDMVTDNTTYLNALRTAYANVGNGNASKITDNLINEYAALPSTDWLGYVVKQGSIANHDLSISGGNKNLKYRWSNNYFDQKHFMNGDYYFKRYSTRINIDMNIRKHLKGGVSLQYRRTDARMSYKDSGFDIFGGRGDELYSHAVMNNPTVQPFDQYGRYGGAENGSGIPSRLNPAGIIDNRFIEREGNNVMGNAYLEYSPLKGLNIRGTLGLNTDNYRGVGKRLTFNMYDRNGYDMGNWSNPASRLDDLNGYSYALTTYLQTTYTKQVGNHNLNLMAGANQETNRYNSILIDERDFGSTDLVTVGQGATRAGNSSSIGKWALASFFGRVNYDYAGKYLLELNIRKDGSSRFGTNNKWGTFPGVSAGYVISKEKFWNIGFINLLKVRASWGILGVQSTASYPFAAKVELGKNYGGASGGAVTNLGNPNLRWEQTKTYDAGLDLNMFDSRIAIEFDAFIKKTDGIITQMENPLTSGVTAKTWVNAASLENKGWDLQITLKNSINDLKLSGSINVSHVTNKILAINPSLSSDADRLDVGGENNRWFIRNQPINAIYGFKFGGIFQESDFTTDANGKTVLVSGTDYSYIGSPKPGDIKYVDLNGNGKIDVDDQTVIGDRNPKFTYGFTINAEYKGFDFSAFFQGIKGADVWIARGYGPFPFDGVRKYWVDNQWTPENKSNTVPRLWFDRSGFNGGSITTENRRNSFWVQDRSYLRLKNLLLGYTLPDKFISKTRIISYMRIYISGQNLITFTKLKELDPERNPNLTYATSVLPQTKMFTVGLNVRF